jgi:hypothetical protein
MLGRCRSIPPRKLTALYISLCCLQFTLGGFGRNELLDLSFHTSVFWQAHSMENFSRGISTSHYFSGNLRSGRPYRQKRRHRRKLIPAAQSYRRHPLRRIRQRRQKGIPSKFSKKRSASTQKKIPLTAYSQERASYKEIPRDLLSRLFLFLKVVRPWIRVFPRSWVR